MTFTNLVFRGSNNDTDLLTNRYEKSKFNINDDN